MEQITVKLIGYKTDHTAARIGKEVFCYQSADKKFTVARERDGIVVTTSKGRYRLVKHPSLNIYTGKCLNIKVHVSLKKVSGTLIYWN